MGLSLLFAFLLLLFDRSSSNTAQPQETSPTAQPFKMVATMLSASPTWYLSVGDTVEINCTTLYDFGNNSHVINMQLFWTKFGSDNTTKTVLTSQKAAKGINYILGPVTHEHQGIYTCDDDGSMPDVHVPGWHYLIWVADDSPRVTLDVISHNKIQFLSTEDFTLGCQLPDTDTNWKMMRFDRWKGIIEECPNQESSGGRISCTSRSEPPWPAMLYWCESSTGERSNALNISTTVKVNLTLESPPLPVLEGEDVILRCLHQNQTTKTFDSNIEAVFYKNNQKIRTETLGSLTLRAVTKADAGFYKCSYGKYAITSSVWVSVKARPDTDQKKKKREI